MKKNTVDQISVLVYCKNQVPKKNAVSLIKNVTDCTARMVAEEEHYYCLHWNYSSMIHQRNTVLGVEVLDTLVVDNLHSYHQMNNVQVHKHFHCRHSSTQILYPC